jgi:hypothetical protein
VAVRSGGPKMKAAAFAKGQQKLAFAAPLAPGDAVELVAVRSDGPGDSSNTAHRGSGGGLSTDALLQRKFARRQAAAAAQAGLEAEIPTLGAGAASVLESLVAEEGGGDGGDGGHNSDSSDALRPRSEELGVYEGGTAQLTASAGAALPARHHSPSAGTAPAMDFTAEPLRNVDWNAISVPNLRLLAEALGAADAVEGGRPQDPLKKARSAPEIKQLMLPGIIARVKALAQKQSAAMLRATPAADAALSGTELPAAIAELREWSQRGQPLFERIQRALSSAAGIDGAAQLTASAVSELGAAVITKNRLDISCERLSTACEQLTPSLTEGADAKRAALNASNPLIILLERQDVRYALLSPRIMDLASLCNLRSVSAQFPGWVQQALSEMPRLQLSRDISERLFMDVNDGKSVTKVNTSTLNMSCMTYEHKKEAIVEQYYGVQGLANFGADGILQIGYTKKPGYYLTTGAQLVVYLRLPDQLPRVLNLPNEWYMPESHVTSDYVKWTECCKVLSLSGNRLMLFANPNPNPGNSEETNSPLIYDLSTDTSLATTMAHKRSCTGLVAGVLADGKVIVTGGIWNASTELFDPTTNTWSDMAARSASFQPTAGTVLSDGRFLVCACSVDLAEVYDPRTDRWSPVKNFHEPTGKSKHIPRKGGKKGVPAHRVLTFQSPLSSADKLLALGSDIVIVATKSKIADGREVQSIVLKVSRLDGLQMRPWTQLKVKKPGPLAYSTTVHAIPA